MDMLDVLNFTFEEEYSETTTFSHDTTQSCGLFPELVEEDLEWLSNKDAFPSVETCFGILSDNPELTLNHYSPISVLDNNNSSNNSNSNNNNSSSSSTLSYCDSLNIPINYPVRARSKRNIKKRTNFGDLTNQVNVKNVVPQLQTLKNSARRCLHCQSDKTPQWRAGPMGPKTLCNACGVRYKSGRLVPEYRPANSPTFLSALHSNSHRKVVEMRKKKYQAMGEGMSEACGYSLG